MATISRLKLTRPLAVFDIESTGLNTRTDRIVEISIIRVEPSGDETTKTWLINPEIPIPKEASDIHGITDEKVANCPVFTEVVDEIDTFMAGCDFAGYNLIHFDIPILEEEFMRSGRMLNTEKRYVLDAQKIFHAKEPRDLTAALKFFCGTSLTDAHSAAADAKATLDVIRGQLEKYADIPENIEAIDRDFNGRDPANIDRAGRFRWMGGEAVVNFGKKKGEKLSDLMQNDRNFLKWVVKSEFPCDTRIVAENALNGILPHQN